MTALTPAYMARLAAKTRNLADDFEEAGYVETPDWLRAIADITEGKFPCGHEPSGPPVDGREVDRYLPYDPLLSPESDEEAMHHGGLSGAMPVVDIADTPQTGGGAGVKGGAT